MGQLLVPPAGDTRTPAEYTYDMQRSGMMYMALPEHPGGFVAAAPDCSLANLSCVQALSDDELIILEWIRRLAGAAGGEELISILEDIDACECGATASCHPERRAIGWAIHQALAAEW